MSHWIRIAPRKDFKSNELWGMYRLRAKVFKGRRDGAYTTPNQPVGGSLFSYSMTGFIVRLFRV